MKLNGAPTVSPAAKATRPRFYWLVLVAATLVFFLFLETAWSVFQNRDSLRADDWNAKPSKRGWVISDVDPHGAAAGKLAPGDRLITLNGSARVAEFGPKRLSRETPVGSTELVEVERGGLRRIVPVQVEKRRMGGPLTLAVHLFIGVLLLLTGAWIGMARPDNRTAQLGFGAFLGGALIFLSEVLASVPVPLGGVVGAMVIGAIWKPFHLAIGYDFNSRFPWTVPEGKLARSIRVSFYIAAAFFWVLINVPVLSDAFGLATSWSLLPALRPLSILDAYRGALLRVFSAIAGMALCIVLVRNYRRVPDADGRRRIRWAAFGFVCASLSFALISISELLLSLSGRSDVIASEFWMRAREFSMLPVLVAPFAFVYAVLKHRVLGVRVVVRRGVQYLLAKNVLRIVFCFPILLIVFSILAKPERTLRDLILNSSLAFYFLLAASAAVILRYRKEMSDRLDRKFFRTAYEQEAMLAALIEDVRRADNLDKMARLVARQIDLALHPEYLSIAWVEAGTRELDFAFVSDFSGDVELASFLSGNAVDLLQSRRGQPSSSVQSHVTVDGHDPRSQRFDGMLIVPMISTEEHLIGLLALGPKKSEEPYSKRDRDLLQAIATQIAMVYQMDRLREQVDHEWKIRNEVLGHLQRDRYHLVNECPECGSCYDSTYRKCELDNTDLTFTLPVRRVIDDKYRLDRRIGSGGMGAVYQAHDLRLNRSVAVKIMTGRLFGNQGAIRRFEREARASASLTHPNIVSIYDFGRLEGGGAYLVMSLLRGDSMRSELDRCGSVAPEVAAIWFDQMCDAMAAAHAVGIVHRDLKPENVFVTHETNADRIAILDFGLAKIRAEAEAAERSLTIPGSVVGTRAYMSPEQRRGAEVDARTDLFAIGVMAVEALSAQGAPDSGATEEWMLSVLPKCSDPHHANALNNLAAVLSRCLAADLDRRYASVADLREDLIPALRSCPDAALIRPKWGKVESSGVTAHVKDRQAGAS